MTTFAQAEELFKPHFETIGGEKLQVRIVDTSAIYVLGSKEAVWAVATDWNSCANKNVAVGYSQKHQTHYVKISGFNFENLITLLEA